MNLIAVASAAVALSGCSGAPATTSPAASTDPAAATASASTAPAGATVSCTYTADGQAARTVTLPPATASKAGTTHAVLKLNGEAVGLTLLNTSAPCTVNSFVSLAKQGFFDKTSCHRLGATTGFEMLQCGDPTATGSGGPGYRFADELTGKETYPAGTLAMANTGQEASNGSQFFLVYGDTTLTPAYTVFGRIDEAGLAVLRKLAGGGTDDSEQSGVGKPKLPAEITAVTIG